jgi:hypothetical protein
VNARDSLNGAHRAALYEQPDDLFNLFVALVGSIQALRPDAKGFDALAAAETLITLPVFPESLALSLAIVAGHFGLSFPRNKPIMRLSVGIVGHSAIAELSPVSVPAEAGLFAYRQILPNLPKSCQGQFDKNSSCIPIIVLI